MIVKPSTAKHWYNLDGQNETTRQLATSGGHELVAVHVSAGSSSIALRVHDSANGAGVSTRSFLVVANAGESFTFAPAMPLPLRFGLYIEMEQGAVFGGEALVLYN